MHIAINSRILLSLALIGAAAALVIGATFAFFSDQGTSNDNIFSSGTLDLKLSDDTPETDQDNVTASFGGSNLAPGQCIPSATTSAQLRAKNSGTINGDHIEITVVNTVTDVGTDSTPLDMDAFLRLDLFDYDGNPISQADTNGNGIFDLDDLEANGVDNLPLTDTATDHNIDLRVCFDSSAGNALQGDSVDSDWTVTLNQDASQ